jgi:hypothetical protein
MIGLEIETLERVGVSPTIEKMVEIRLSWFGYVEEILINFVLRSVN